MIQVISWLLQIPLFLSPVSAWMSVSNLYHDFRKKALPDCDETLRVSCYHGLVVQHVTFSSLSP